MTKKTLLYYLIPLLVVCIFIGGLSVLFVGVFADLIKHGFRVSLLLVQVLSIIGVVVLVVLFLRRLIPFCKVFYYRREVEKFHFDINMSNRCEMKDGAPGTGKTFTSIYVTCYKAIVLWEELVTQYLLHMPFAAKYLYDYQQGKSTFWIAYKAVYDIGFK